MDDARSSNEEPARVDVGSPHAGSLVAARQAEQTAYQQWQALYQELNTLQLQVEQLAQREQHAYQAYVEAAEQRSQIEREGELLPTSAEALQETPQAFVDGFIEMTTIVTRRPEPLC